MSLRARRRVIPRSALGIDVGLTGVRSAVLDEDGGLAGSSRRPLRQPVAHGRAEQDPLLWLEAALDAGREAAAGCDGVEAVAVCALGPAPILVDAQLEPLTPALLFSLDRRAEQERAALGLTHDHALPKLLWWRRHEAGLARRAAWALDATGFLVSRLTGRPVQDAITSLDYLHGDERPFPLPEPASPLEPAGALSEGAARALGLTPGIPVAVGTYDTYADVAATGVRAPGDACVLLGSTLVVCRAVAAPVECPGLELTPHLGEGHLLGGWTASAGATLDWFERELGAVTGAEALEPGAAGVLALPYLAGERTPVWDPYARGVLAGLTLGTSRTELYRALVDGVALSARDHLERLRAAGLEPRLWYAGGGGTRDEAWLRATCDALAAPLAVVRHAGEAIGPAVLALRAIGSDAPLSFAREVLPDPGRSARFDELYPLYRELYPATAALSRRLGELAEDG